MAVSIGYCEADADVGVACAVGADRCVDPHQFAVSVGQRPTGVAGVDRSVGLDHGAEAAVGVRHRAIGGRHDAGGHRLLQLEGAADGNGQLARFEVGAGPDGGDGQVAVRGRQDRDVVAGIRPEDLDRDHQAVGGPDPDLVCSGDHMVVGQQQAVVVDHAGTLAEIGLDLDDRRSQDSCHVGRGLDPGGGRGPGGGTLGARGCVRGGNGGIGTDRRGRGVDDRTRRIDGLLGVAHAEAEATCSHRTADQEGHGGDQRRRSALPGRGRRRLRGRGGTRRGRESRRRRRPVGAVRWEGAMTPSDARQGGRRQGSAQRRRGRRRSADGTAGVVPDPGFRAHRPHRRREAWRYSALKRGRATSGSPVRSCPERTHRGRKRRQRKRT